MSSQQRISEVLFLHNIPSCPGREHNSDQSLAVRETSVSRYHGGPIEGPFETPQTTIELSY